MRETIKYKYMYNPYKITLPFVDYITVSHDTARSEIPNTSEQIVVDKSKQEEPVQKRTFRPAPAVVQDIPEEIKIDTEAYTPIEETAKKSDKKELEVKKASYVVQTPFAQQTPLVLRSAENKEWSTPWSSPVQVSNYLGTYTPEQSNLGILNKPRIKISEGVDLTDEVENNILRKMYELGVSGHITSNIRKGAVAPNGNPSYHSWGDAFDLRPVKDDSPEAHAILYQQMKTSGFLKYLNDLGYYVYYEDESRNPNSTGRHFHIGKDIKANNPYVVKASDGLKFKSHGIVDSRKTFD